MKWVFKIFLFLFLLSLWSCTDKNPVEVHPLLLKEPVEPSFFERQEFKQNGSFQPGYSNGNIRSTQVRLKWQKYTGSDFLCYRIFRDGNKIGDITNADSIQFTDKNLVQNTYYQYRIACLNQSGLYQLDTIKIKTPLFLPPDQFNFQVIDSSSIKLFWKNRAESASHFRILRKKQNEPSSMFQVVGTTTDTFFVDHNLTNHEYYHYQVIAYNQWEETLPSNPYLVYVNYVMDPPTLNSVVQIPLRRSVKLEWSDNSNAEDGFRIYRKEGTGNFSLIGSVAANTTEYVDNDTTQSLQIGTTYYYYITAYNRFEETDPSNIASITITPPPNYVEIGTGTFQWSYPFNTYYHDARTQVIYLATEIGGPLTIHKIGFYVTRTPGQVMNNFTIRMKHTSLSSYSSSNFDNFGYTTCFTGNLEIATTGWVEIPLDTPFLYNGTDNLIIDISFDNDSWTSNGRSYATYTGSPRSIYQHSDSGMGNPLNWNSGSLSNYVPNIRLYKSAR